GVAPGGVEPDAQQELPGGVPAAAAVATGGAQGDHGGGAPAGADRVQPDALRRGVHEAGGGSLRGASPGAAGEAVTPASDGIRLRADEGRVAGDAAGGGTGVVAAVVRGGEAAGARGEERRRGGRKGRRARGA